MTRERAPPTDTVSVGFPVDRNQESRRMYAVMDGEKIEAMRQERGLSRQELAERAGIAVDTVARVERSERVRAKTGWRVALVFGLHPKEIGRPAPTDPLWRGLLGLEETTGANGYANTTLPGVQDVFCVAYEPSPVPEEDVDEDMSPEPFISLEE
jgi:transcriptional regulator with XRE-family HTH domain